jgi:hypothetical protein
MDMDDGSIAISHQPSAMTSDEKVLPHVRPLARNKIGFQGNGLGIAQAGDTVAFILPATAEDMIVQAVKRAVEERGVKVNLVQEYEVAGVSRDDAARFEKARRTFTSEQAYMEATWWVETNYSHFYPLRSGQRRSGPKATEH